MLRCSFLWEGREGWRGHSRYYKGRINKTQLLFGYGSEPLTEILRSGRAANFGGSFIITSAQYVTVLDQEGGIVHGQLEIQGWNEDEGKNQ